MNENPINRTGDMQEKPVDPDEEGVVDRRSFLKKIGKVGAATALGLGVGATGGEVLAGSRRERRDDSYYERMYEENNLNIERLIEKIIAEFRDTDSLYFVGRLPKTVAEFLDTDNEIDFRIKDGHTLGSKQILSISHHDGEIFVGDYMKEEGDIGFSIQIFLRNIPKLSEETKRAFFRKIEKLLTTLDLIRRGEEPKPEEEIETGFSKTDVSILFAIISAKPEDFSKTCSGRNCGEIRNTEDPFLSEDFEFSVISVQSGEVGSGLCEVSKKGDVFTIIQHPFRTIVGKELSIDRTMYSHLDSKMRRSIADLLKMINELQ